MHQYCVLCQQNMENCGRWESQFSMNNQLLVFWLFFGKSSQQGRLKTSGVGTFFDTCSNLTKLSWFNLKIFVLSFWNFPKVPSKIYSQPIHPDKKNPGAWPGFNGTNIPQCHYSLVYSCISAPLWQLDTKIDCGTVLDHGSLFHLGELFKATVLNLVVISNYKKCAQESLVKLQPRLSGTQI